MNARTLLIAGLAAGALSSLTTIALAQGAAAPAAPPLTYGPNIPGFCTFSEGGIIESSKVGQAVLARMKILKSQVDAELQPEATSIQTDMKAFDTQAPALDAATRQSRGTALQTRYASFQKLAQQRSEELQETQQKELQAVEHEMEPILRSLFTQHQCSVLVEREAGGVRVVNPNMDVTAPAITQLDARIQTLTFDRVHLDNQPASVPAGVR